MKKILALILALSLVLALAACSGSDSGNSGSDKAEPTEAPEQHIKDDAAVPGMSFTPPEGFVSVERMLDKTSDGKLTEKNLKYYYDKDVTLNYAYAYANGQVLTDIVKAEELETVECGDTTFYIKESSGSLIAIAQIGEYLYGIEYAREKDSKDREMFDNALKNIKFEDVKSVEDNEDPESLGNISYELDSSLNVASTYSDMTEDSDGNLQKKAMSWRFGKDKDNIDFRFLIRYDKDTKIEDAISKDATYEDDKFGELPCKVRKDGESGKIYEYYIQNGSDVYEIKNLGSSGGWFSSRSDESYDAFDKFVKTISFNEAAE